MRALCGAIITAGALIGLGLTALGYGLRYGGPAFGPESINPSTNNLWARQPAGHPDRLAYFAADRPGNRFPRLGIPPLSAVP